MPFPFKCERCGKELWSFAEIVESWGKVYCKSCNPGAVVPQYPQGVKRESKIVAQQSSARRETIPKSVQRSVWRRDGGKCVECQSKEKLEFDHIIPVTKGGNNTERNIQLLCEPCNRRKHNSIG